MKKILPAIIMLLISASIVNAQSVTITPADFPSMGTLVINAVDNVTTVSPGNPGLNQVWDLSNLTTTSWDSTYYVSPAGLPAASNYPLATLAASHNPSSSNYSYDFMETTGNGWKYHGNEQHMTIFADFTMNLHVGYVPASYQLELPFSYGDSKTESLVITLVMATRNAGVLMDSSKTVKYETIVMTGDAEGTMILPDGSFPALRVKEAITSVDSNFTWNGSSWAFSDTIHDDYTNYRWYANNFGQVGELTVNSKKENNFTFFKAQIVGVKEPVKNKISVYPNPASAYVTINTEGTVNKVEVTDAAGKTSISYYNQKTINTSSLAPGIYIIKVYTDKGTFSSKFVKE